MENRLIALELVLNELGLDSKIDNLADRISLQKAVYLSQEAGVKLGYRFSWYVRGPYSTGLTRDYYDLQVATVNDDEPNHGKRLKDDLRARLQQIKPIFMPDDSDSEDRLNPLDRSEWLELLASIHYLHKKVGNRNGPDAARDGLKEIKPHFADYICLAEQCLADVGLLTLCASPRTSG